MVDTNQTSATQTASANSGQTASSGTSSTQASTASTTNTNGTTTASSTNTSAGATAAQPTSTASSTNASTGTSTSTQSTTSSAASPDHETTTYDAKTGFTEAEGNIDVHYFDQFGSLVGTELTFRAAGIGAPQNSTFIAPPTTTAGQVAVFTAGTEIPALGTWAVEEDHRGTKVYSETDGSALEWAKPGAIDSGYTTVAPTTPYDKWDATNQKWTTDETALHTALKAQANNILNSQIIPLVSLVGSEGATLGPKYTAYRTAMTKIAWGTDTTSTELPTAPDNPTE